MTISQSIMKMLFSCRKQIKKVMDYSICDVDEIYSIRNPDFVLTQDILGVELITFSDFATLSKSRDDEPVLEFLQKFHDNLEDGTIIVPNPNKIMIDKVGEITIKKYSDESLSASFGNKLLTVWDRHEPITNVYQQLIQSHIDELI